jgi:hypothetical protein
VANTYVPADLRRLVAKRATSLCEYCLVHEDDTFFGCEVDYPAEAATRRMREIV